MESPTIWKIIISVLLLSSFGCIAKTCDPPKNLIKSGDLIYRYENSLVSDLVLKYQGEKSYSHVGIAVTHGPQIKVIHSLLNLDEGIDGVTSQDYCGYIKDALRIEVKRLKKINGGIQNRLLNSIETNQNKKFNRTFDFNSQDSVYCTQYVWMVYKDALHADPFKLKPNSNLIITVRDLLASNAFYTVLKSPANTSSNKKAH